MSTDAVRAALAELVAATVPDGWQLVPKEPTLEMLRAAVQVKEGPAVYKVMSFAGLAVLEEDTKDEYTAALAAAPSPTPQGADTMRDAKPFNPRSDALKARDEPGKGDDLPCVKCGAKALDTGLECSECGHDNYEAVTGRPFGGKPSPVATSTTTTAGAIR